MIKINKGCSPQLFIYNQRNDIMTDYVRKVFKNIPLLMLIITGSIALIIIVGDLLVGSELANIKESKNLGSDLGGAAKDAGSFYVVMGVSILIGQMFAVISLTLALIYAAYKKKGVLLLMISFFLGFVPLMYLFIYMGAISNYGAQLFAT